MRFYNIKKGKLFDLDIFWLCFRIYENFSFPPIPRITGKRVGGEPTYDNNNEIKIEEGRRRRKKNEMETDERGRRPRMKEKNKETESLLAHLYLSFSLRLCVYRVWFIHGNIKSLVKMDEMWPQHIRIHPGVVSRRSGRSKTDFPFFYILIFLCRFSNI